MNLRLPRFLRFNETQADIDAALRSCAMMSGIIDDKYIRRTEHDERVRDLIDCNNRELERRRSAETECEHLEREVMRAIAKAHENTGLAKAIDWMATQTVLRPEAFLAIMSSFVAGFTGHGNPHYERDEGRLAYQAGIRARSKDVALGSALQTLPSATAGSVIRA